MKVLIDADACPVTDIVLRLCNHFQTECILVCDTAHEYCYPGCRVLLADKGTDSTDLLLANHVSIGDIVVTQDYGLASICLARDARVIHQDGWLYTPDNIDALLFQRHESRKIRATGGRLKGPRKRSRSQNENFEEAFRVLLQSAVQG